MDKIILITFVGIQLVSGVIGLGCLDENGNSVDWMVLYKLPKTKTTPVDIVDEGLGYTYFTSSSSQSGWILSEKSMNDSSSIPGRILSPLYNTLDDNNIMYAFYNDQPPHGSPTMIYGHTKGVVAFDKSTGFWLIHSVPHYPPDIEKDGNYEYPHSGQNYGQTFLCVSLRTQDTANVIGSQLLYNRPFMYSTKVPDWGQINYPNFYQATLGRHIKNPPYYHTAPFKSLQGELFSSFAKYTDFDKDLYADLVAPSLKCNLLAETWPNGAGKMNSSCNLQFHVENIDELDFLFENANFDDDFTTTHDHSKWAVAKDKTGKDEKYVCIGDINRMESQLKRAGGTVCFAHHYAWKAFTGIIKVIENCNKVFKVINIP